MSPAYIILKQMPIIMIPIAGTSAQNTPTAPDNPYIPIIMFLPDFFELVPIETELEFPKLADGTRWPHFTQTAALSRSLDPHLLQYLADSLILLSS
jgi:hypothetical protein